MSQLKTILASLLAVATLGGCSPSSPHGGTVDPAADPVRAAISDAWRSHLDAARRKDAKGVMAIYADDIVYAIPGTQEVRGRAALETMETQGLAAADVLDVQHTTHDLRVFDDAAYEIGTVAGPVQPTGKPARIVTFHFMALWQRQGDGTWRLRHLVGRPQEGVD